MKQVNWPKRFEVFLDSQSKKTKTVTAWDRFLLNFHSSSSIPLDDFFEKFNPSHYMSAGFLFYATSEGGRYWVNLNRKWQNEMIDIKIEFARKNAFGR